MYLPEIIRSGETGDLQRRRQYDQASSLSGTTGALRAVHSLDYVLQCVRYSGSISALSEANLAKTSVQPST
jgi:hypothetical protein